MHVTVQLNVVEVGGGGRRFLLYCASRVQSLLGHRRVLALARLLIRLLLFGAVLMNNIRRRKAPALPIAGILR